MQPETEESATLLLREARLLGTAIMFLTRLPVGNLCSAEPIDLARSTRWFPLVGFLIALLVSLVYYLASLLLPVSVSIVLMLVASVMLTGAFHEDGLADVADSAGAFGLDAKLEIMRDSRVGTYGSLALILLITLKSVLLFELASLSVASLFVALVVAHVSSRWSSVWLMAKHDYVRPEAANKIVAQGVDGRRLWQASFVAVLILAGATVAVGLGLLAPLVLLLIGTSALCGWYFQRVFGGITGDCLGAGNQVLEVTMLAGSLVLFA